jgi:hypothetical protein
MSISAIDAFNANFSLTSYLTAANREEEEESLAGSVSRKNSLYSAYGANRYSGPGKAALERAVEELRAQGGAVTFERVKDYQKELEDEFVLLMQAGLALAGVEESEDFRLVADAGGNIDILCSDPALKEKVAALLEENDKLRERFLYIQALGNMGRAAQSLGSRQALENARADLASLALDIFINGASQTGYSPLLGDFSGAEPSFILGANLTV